MLNPLRTIILTLFLMSAVAISPAWAEDIPSSQRESKAFLDDIAGVYKYPVKGLWDYMVKMKYDAEDILEIVPLTENTAYVRTRLNFDNYHVCYFWGITEYKSPHTLVYHDTRYKKDQNAHECYMSLNINKEGDIRFDLMSSPKDANCIRSMEDNYSCSARGSFGMEKFHRSQKRPIRYLERLFNSNEYKAALEEYNSR